MKLLEGTQGILADDSVSRDKLRALQVLSRHRVGIPTTLFRRRLVAIGAID